MGLRAGDCAWCEDFGGRHITIVLNDPKGDPPSVILVNITTWTKRKEQTVILTPEDHPDIIQNSIVHYAKSAIVEEKMAERLFSNRLSRATEQMMKKVRDGFLRSDQVPGKVKMFFLS